MKYLRFALFPFAVLYGLAVRFRNHLYDIGSKKSVKFDLPVICVGNLVAGGAGKTPMVERILRNFGEKYKMATLSRGYGRRTRGFRITGDSDNHLTVGDEPYQVYKKFGDTVLVAVGEERALAIPQILLENPDINLIVLDDAFQHRAVTVAVNILLTDYKKPFYRDYILPMGMLREPRSGAKRADIIVVTKAPAGLSISEGEDIKRKILKYSQRNVPVFFTTITYESPVCFAGNAEISKRVIGVTGIAKPSPFFQFLSENHEIVEKLTFPDHHKFTAKDVEKMISDAKSGGDEVSIVTTEKDYVRLLTFQERILNSDISFFYVPIRTTFLFEENKFDKRLGDAIIAFERNKS